MLHFQDPYFSDSYTLHEALIQSCSTSIQGKGAYAFATKSGIEILLKDSVFESLLDRGEYSLIVGIDDYVVERQRLVLKGESLGILERESDKYEGFEFFKMTDKDERKNHS